ncbi:MAG: aldose epimerase [Gloeocapsa sp. DLM2.Bin57]|nr:MAG: aldose epimerase [Gloeocapsa sp. DLM2.Bin57]
MFKIASTQSLYKTYHLSDEIGQSEISVVPERGGIVTEWRWQNQDIFYLDRERFQDPKLSVRGGIPLLFPICGNLVDDTYEYEGKTYKLAQHGFARNLPWEVTQESREGKASITVSLKSNAETLLVYPFDFELDFIYTIKGNTLELVYRHRNLSDQSMPFATGIHPYFYVADKSQLLLEIPATEYQAKGDTKKEQFTGEFDFNREEIDVAFTNLSANIATVTDKHRQLKLSIEYDKNYSTLVFWTVKNKDFYCLEPWSSPRNALNTGEKLLIAEPGETQETKIVFTIESLT